MKVNLNIPSTHYMNILSWDQKTIDKIVQSAIDAAVKLGIRLEDDYDGVYLNEAEKKGAKIDRNANTVMFKRKDIEKTIDVLRKTNPSTQPLRELHKSRERNDKFLVGNGANLLFDWENWTARAPEVSDLIDVCYFTQGCSDTNCLFAPVMIKDINQFIEPLYNYAVTCKYCGKKVLHEQATDPIHVKYLEKMARVVEKHRSYFQPMQQWEYINPPFKIGLRAIETMLARVDTGACKTMGIGSMCISGMTAPVTIPGLAVNSLAEILSGLSLFNILRPGYGLECNVCTGNLNLRSGMVSYYNMRVLIQNLAVWELIERGLGVNCSTLTWYRDANEPGMQALYEYGMAQAFFSSIYSNEGPEIGGLSCGNIFSPEQAVLDMEIIKEYNELTYGFSLNKDSLGIDEIINGRFDSSYHISTEHTLKNMHDNLPFSDFLFRGLPGGTHHDKNYNQTTELINNAAEAVKSAKQKGRETEPDSELGAELYEYVRQAATELDTECPPMV